jgi:hypothetical protein
MSHFLPPLVHHLTIAHDAWVVGSGARPDADYKKLRDYDVIVPFSEWQRASLLIPTDAKPNTFRGWKCRSEGAEVDVWPGELGWLITNVKCEWIWHPRTGVRWHKQT